MFTGSAQWYDALYSFKDYAREAEQIISILKREHPQARSVLDIACGTAEHDRYLAEAYQVDGLDINPDFIRIASGKNPDGQYFRADMTDFELPKRYDAVLCLFSSIGYAKNIDNVTKAFRCFREHLNPGGIVVVEPWFTPDVWRPDGSVYLLTAETSKGKICRMNISDQAGSLSIIDFHYLVGTSAGVEHFTERHELGLLSVDEMKSAFEAANLAASYDEHGLTGRGLYVARKESL